MSYMSVYVSRGIESISHGPCWSIRADITEPGPSEQQIEAEAFAVDGMFNFISSRSKHLMANSATWESENMSSAAALAELNEIATEIAQKLTASLQ